MMNYVYFLLFLSVFVLILLAFKIKCLIGNLMIRFGEGLDNLIDGEVDGDKMADNVIEEAEYIVTSIRHYILTAAFLVFTAVYLMLIK